MKRTLSITCVFLTLTAGVAAAGGGGLNLGWGACGGHPASLNADFACNTNTGAHSLWGSFVAPSFVTAMTGSEMVLDLQAASAEVPAWWAMRPSGTCRSGSLSSNFDFTTADPVCHDYWQGVGVGGHVQDPIVAGQNRTRFRLIAAIAQGSPEITAIPEGLEVYSFKLNINHARTTGAGSCPGCQVAACIVLNSIKLYQPADNPGGNKFISALAVRNFVTWQGGLGTYCLDVTPARNTTWGSVKALYR